MTATISGLALQQHERPARRAADRSANGEPRRCGLACPGCVVAPPASGLAPLGCEKFTGIARASSPQGWPVQGRTALGNRDQRPAGQGRIPFGRQGPLPEAALGPFGPSAAAAGAAP
jgi:hypothetical protein